VTAHWICKDVCISSGSSHPLLFDYGGFPPESYKYQYNAPGNPELADKIQELLKGAGIKSSKDSKRGWDHGVFVPLMLMFPAADIPVVAMSLQSSLDPSLHIKIGKALSVLREEGVLIIGSGASFHNFDYFFSRNPEPGVKHSAAFNTWLVSTSTSSSLTPEERLAEFAKWSSAPSALECHKLGQEEHLIPLHVVAGAALGERGVAVEVGSQVTGYIDANFQTSSIIWI